MKPFLKFSLAAVLVLFAFLPEMMSRPGVPGSEDDGGEDRLVRLMNAKSVRMMEIDGKSYRKAEGPARFLHNDTWLICDTALWNVDDRVIYAIGNVSIEQENTELTSDFLTYVIDSSVAQFRGALVELKDKDLNTLRTRNLDYYTDDSVAVFRSGASFRDKDGQLIESLDGRYDSRAKLFTFRNEVNMFSDSVFIKTSQLRYHSATSLATFPEYAEAWKDDAMISGNRGWYNNEQELFFFRDDVHVLSADQEGWCDSLYYYRNTKNISMLGNAQVSDEGRGVTSLSGSIDYIDSLSRVVLRRDPVVIMASEQKEKGTDVPGKDTVYFRADTINYWTLPAYAIDSVLIEESRQRLEMMEEDPVANVRKKAAEAAAKARQEALDNDPNTPPELRSDYKKNAPVGGKASEGTDPEAGKSPAGEATPETLASPAAANSRSRDNSLSHGNPLSRGAMPETLSRADSRGDSIADSRAGSRSGSRADSLAVTDAVSRDAALSSADSSAVADSLSLADSLALADSLTLADSLVTLPPVEVDSTKLGFLSAMGRVKVFRSTMQVTCDSLRYCDLDSLVRLFKSPIVWNEETHQYNADSISIQIQDGRMTKASLMSEAFIHVKEDENHYDQIRGTEMMAYFDEDNQLARFDAMGSANAIFYFREKEKIGTANKKEATMLSADFVDGEVNRITYYEAPKSNAYPVAQMKKEDKFLKGFNWQPDVRPKSPQDITLLKPRKSQRAEYEAHPRAEFAQTERFFSGYMSKIYREIERSDSLRRVSSEARRKAKEEKEAAEKALADSLAASGKDSLIVAAPDSLKGGTDSLNRADTVVAVQLDSAALAAADSLRRVTDSLYNAMTPAQKRALERKQERERRLAAREAALKKKQAEREARWAILDEKERKKAEEKQARKTARLEERRRKEMETLMARMRKEQEQYEAYKSKYMRRYGVTEVPPEVPPSEK